MQNVVLLKSVDGKTLLSRFDCLESKIQLLSSQLQTAANSDTETLYSRKQVSELLRVSLVTLHNWKVRGVLSPCKAGGRILYRKKDIEQLLTKNTKRNDC